MIKSAKKYVKPVIESFSDQELMDLIVANASCPHCYNGCNYICW